MKTEMRLLALALMLFVLIVASCHNQAAAEVRSGDLKGEVTKRNS